MAEEEFFLDRTRLVGPIDHKTPICVLREILGSHGGNLDETHATDPHRISVFLRDKIRSLQIIRLKITDGVFTNADYRSLARYINPKISEWSRSQILRSFNFLYHFVPQHFRTTFEVGQLSPSQPEAYNACILYSICRYKHLRVAITTTMEEMGSVIAMSTIPREMLVSQMTELIPSLPTSQLVNIITMTRNEREHSTSVRRPSSPSNSVVFPSLGIKKDESRVTNDSLNAAYETFSETPKLMSRVVARNNSEAVIIGAIVYGINLMMSKYPLRELHVLETTTGLGSAATGNYIPFDTDFRYAYLRNPRWFNVKENWAASIPRIYSRERLQELALKEGYSPQEIQTTGAPNILFLSRTIPNFYPGKHPSLARDAISMIGMEDIDSVDNDVVVSFGIETERQEMVFYRIRELTSQFKHDLNFTNPAIPTEVFSSCNIRKLFQITEANMKKYTEGVIFDENQQLSVMIKNIYLWQESSDQSKELRNFYLRQTEADRDAIRTYLNSAFELSMYMRGWKVSSDQFPILEAQTDPRQRAYQIEKNVVEAMIRFKNVRSETHQKLRYKLDHLKLMKLHKSTDGITYSLVTDPDDGVDLVGRIKIVEMGDEPRSCIRVSSNILVPTTYYYLMAIDAAPELDISRIEYIS